MTDNSNIGNIKAAAKKARLILVPKGDDNRPCLTAFEAATGIKVPEFADRKLEAEAGGRTFVKVKGRDIPRFIAGGFGDIGLAGSDSCEDYLASEADISYRTFGPLMCRFALLAPAARAAAVRRRLRAGSNLEVATSFPGLLAACADQQGFNLTPLNMPICGSIEIMPKLLGVPLVADLVSSGATAKANGLVEIGSLLDVYPAVIVRSRAGKRRASVSSDDIDRIDTVLATRNRQLSDRAVNSYTLSLMRDANEAGKKAGEEFGEVMMAIAGSGDTADCESEIADLTYAQLVAAYSRGKPARLGNVLRILVERNRSGGRP
jgi:ATP phosphoribosyltransferase